MPVTSDLLQASLDDAYDAAVLAGRGLREQLRYYETEARAAVAGGSVSSASTGGQSTAYAPSGAGNITALEWVSAWRTLINSFDRVSARITSPTDGVIKAAMLADLESAVECYPDMSGFMP